MTCSALAAFRSSISALLVWLVLLPAPAAAADQRFIIRTQDVVNGLEAVNTACVYIGCTVQYGLDGSLGRVFLVTAPDTVDPQSFLALIVTLTGIQDAEIDVVVRTMGTDPGSAPPALLDTEPVSYYGATVQRGYVGQPANGILGITAVQSQFGVTGLGVTVAVIDTGIDPDHPAFAGVLVKGHDFTRNVEGGSEKGDVDQSVIFVLDSSNTVHVSPSTMTMLDPSTTAALDAPEYAAFGHGTMVAGCIHLVAPRANIMPIKAFRADGSGYSSDVIRAIYFAVDKGAKVINMSFSFATPSDEVARTIDYASSTGVISVGSAGNGGLRTLVYPAARSNVIGVAATRDDDVLTTFSNFGPELAWLAAPGEGIVTTYPYGSYAAGWGTSFSAPFAAGEATLLAEVYSQITPAQAADAAAHAVWFSSEVRWGRIDMPAAIAALRTALGLP